MQIGNVTTPFGRRSMSVAHFRAQTQAYAIDDGTIADKWQVYRWLCEGKENIGVGDRALAVLNALLSFLPHNELSKENGLIVFPSNVQLSMRAHGMADTTLRRHLASLVECGLITRKDSPNGKRYSRKGRGGETVEAFGFSLAPLLVRAEEFKKAAECVRAERYALKLVRERLTLHRRDIAKLIEVALTEEAQGDWQGLWTRFRAIVEGIPRRAALADLEAILAVLAALHDEVAICLENHLNTKNSAGNESHIGRQLQNSNPELLIELEHRLRKGNPGNHEPQHETTEEVTKTYTLGLVLKACPQIADYAPTKIANWRDLMAATAQVRGYLGVSPSAYEDALDALGQERTAIVIACILEKVHQINSPGGYLRALTQKARAGEFSVGPMLMACLRITGAHLQVVPR